MEFLHILLDIWKRNKIEFIFWIIILLIIIPFVITVLIHRLINEVVVKFFPSLATLEIIVIGLVAIISILFIDTLFVMLISRFHQLHLLVGRRCKGKREVRHSIKNITYYLLNNLTVNNLYGNILMSKLVGVHKPKEIGELGSSFWFIRHEKDFESHPHSSPRYPIRQQLLEKQIDDFHTIQTCIKKYWSTVSYGDIKVLLEKPEYISQNIKMISGLFRRTKVRRLFVYPYYHQANKIGNFIQDELKPIILEKSVLNNIISTKITGFPTVAKLDTIRNVLAPLSLDAARAIRDIIYLIWLVKLHEHFKMDYRIVPRHLTTDGADIDIVGRYLLNSWNDDGSALIDNQVVVRFDDQMKVNGVIYYEFIKSPDKTQRYKATFDNIFGSLALPTRYTYHERSRGRTEISKRLEEFLSIFFSKVTCNTFLNISACEWTGIIEKELEKK